MLKEPSECRRCGEGEAGEGEAGEGEAGEGVGGRQGRGQESRPQVSGETPCVRTSASNDPRSGLASPDSCQSWLRLILNLEILLTSDNYQEFPASLTKK